MNTPDKLKLQADKDGKKTIKVAFAGNPNVGKTSLLNCAAKTDLKVGNWSGVTVEKREGSMTYKGYDIHFIDLPGIYTLEPLSEDEWVAYNFLVEEHPDVIVDVIETTNAERDLLLTTELLEFGRPMVLALNMTDEATRRGIEINCDHSRELLNIPVVKTNGRNGSGVQELLDAIVRCVEDKSMPNMLKYSDIVEESLANIGQVNKSGKIDKHTLLNILSSGDGENKEKIKLEKYFKKNISTIVKEERYAFANGFYSEVFTRKKSAARDVTDRIDRWVLHPFIGFAIFLLVMFLIFNIVRLFQSAYELDDGLNKQFLLTISLVASCRGRRERMDAQLLFRRDNRRGRVRNYFRSTHRGDVFSPGAPRNVGVHATGRVHDGQVYAQARTSWQRDDSASPRLWL